MPLPRLYTIEEVAEALTVPPADVEQLLETGLLPYVEISGHRRMTEAQVESFVRASVRIAPPSRPTPARAPQEAPPPPRSEEERPPSSPARPRVSSFATLVTPPARTGTPGRPSGSRTSRPGTAPATSSTPDAPSTSGGPSSRGGAS
jgi:excisionase family DNA binding protein